MASVTRRMQKQLPLREKLARVRREKAEGKRPNKAPPPELAIGKSVFSNCGPNGERREHPQVSGLNWLRYFAESLRLHGLCWAARVETLQWEKDGCLKLYLQRIVHAEAHALRVVGSKVVQEHRSPIGGGMWDCWRLPVEAVNNHDTRWILRKLFNPKEADIVLAGNPVIRAMEGLA